MSIRRIETRKINLIFNMSTGLPPSLPIGIDPADLVHSPHYPGLGVAMAAAQQLAMMTSQSISFITHGMPPLYTSPSGKN